MPEKKIKHLTTLKEIRVMNDPYRREIMTAIRLIGKPATAKEVADYLGEPPSKVNYHIGILYKHEFIDLDHTETINGIIAKFYVMSKCMFKIKMEGKNSQTKEMAALRDIVSSTFDVARDKYIASVAYAADNQEVAAKNDEDLLYSRKVYMSKEEIAELSKFVDRVAENSKEGKEPYELFVAYTSTD